VLATLGGSAIEPRLALYAHMKTGQRAGDRVRAGQVTGQVGGLDVNPPAPVRLPAPAPHRRAGQHPLTGDIVSFG
jgi:hypothetical protein